MPEPTPAAENAPLLADWFASMCEQDAETPHVCNAPIAAHDVAQMIRGRLFAPEVDTPPASTLAEEC